MSNCNLETINQVLNKRMKNQSFIYTIIICLMLWIRFRKGLDRARLIKNYFHLYHSLQIRAMIQNINTTIFFLLLKVEFYILCTKFSLFFYATSSFVLFLLLFFCATSIYLFIYFFIYLSIYVFIFSFIYLFICLLFIYLFT